MSGEIVFPFRQALANMRERPASRWPDIAGEFAGAVLPVVEPSFRLEPGDEIFTIGSCFARNIEAHLARLGCRIPMLDFILPPEEWHGLPNQALNMFTPPSFSQLLDWTAAVQDTGGKVAWDHCEALAFDCGDGLFFDMELLAHSPVSQARFVERRQEVYDVTRSAFTASCVIMTPGLIEGWRDRETGLFISGSILKYKKALAAGGRFELVVLDYKRSFDDMAAALDLVRARNPGCKFLITTSPVPLSATFSGQDIRIANTYSKSVLRAVCGALAYNREATDYFPSYESVTLSHPEGVWNRDRIHVTDAFVGRIVGRLAEAYMGLADPVLVHGQKAATALAGGDFETAAREAAAVLAIAPMDYAANMVRIDVALGRGQSQAAAEMIETLPADVGAMAATRLRLAKAVFGKDPRRGAAIGVEACALPDADRDAFLSTNKMLALVKASHDEREAVLRAGIERFPQQAPIRVALASVLELKGQIAEAISELSKAQALPKVKSAMVQFISRELARLTAQDG